MKAAVSGPPRWALVAAAAGVVVVGLVVRQVPGALGDLVGGVLYAVLVTLLAAIVAPRARPTMLGVVALAVCVAVELAQLTDGPAAAADAVPALRYVLGTTFAAPDLAAYAVGVAMAAGGLAVARAAAARKAQAAPDPGR